ncbi:zinc finger matrin-type protein 1 [Pholidichthys leucotaenia]
MSNDKDRFCELCNMVFSSPIVAKSHYEGKVHLKNLRKKGLHPPGRLMEQAQPTVAQEKSDQKPSSDVGVENVLQRTLATLAPDTEVNPTDPDKYCSLCDASFNNPQMASQHYKGRKHQRNKARQKLLEDLGKQQANSLMCPLCSIQFNSVEMYQSHMQGSKHQAREKNVIDMCNSQQKVYTTFADELADYIQVQKARGITPKTNEVLLEGSTQMEFEAYQEEEEQEGLNKGGIMMESNERMLNIPPISRFPYQSEMGPSRPSHYWNYSYPHLEPWSSGSPQFSSWPVKRRRHRPSSSSSYSTSLSSSYSSCSNSESDSGHSENRGRIKSRNRSLKREKDKRGRNKESKEERRRTKHRKRERDYHSEERRRDIESVEGRRKKLKVHGKKSQKEKKVQDDFEEKTGQKIKVEHMMENRKETDLHMEDKDDIGVQDDNFEEKTGQKIKVEHMMENRKETDLHIQDKDDIGERDGGHSESAKHKDRKKKKKMKEKADTRTEEEKLWDDSILGC